MTVNLTMQNWITTVGGLLAGVPVLIINSGMVLTPKWTQILSIIGGLGTLLIGLAAKDWNTHSTTTQVAAATAKVAAGETPKV